MRRSTATWSSIQCRLSQVHRNKSVVQYVDSETTNGAGRDSFLKRLSQAVGLGRSMHGTPTHQCALNVRGATNVVDGRVRRRTDKAATARFLAELSYIELFEFSKLHSLCAGRIATKPQLL